jgi:hypothetical protein
MSTKTAKPAAPAATNLTAPPAVKKVVKPAETAAPAPVAATPAPAAAAPAKKAAAAPKKEEAVVAPAPVAAPATPAPAPAAVEVVAEAAPVTEAAAPAVVEGGAGALGAASEEKLKAVVSRVNELLDTLKVVANELKVLQKQVGKDFKEAAKCSRSRRGKRGGVAGAEKAKRSPSGFAKPTDLTPALCTFLGIEEGTQLARTEVTKKITEYIKTHNLQNPANKKIIIPDTTLATLLNNNGEEVTYFNLQKFLKVHFIKTV